MNLSDYMHSQHFNEIVRAHIEQQFEQEAQRWRALMTGRRALVETGRLFESVLLSRRTIPLPVYDVLDAEIVLDDILDAAHIG